MNRIVLLLLVLALLAHGSPAAAHGGLPVSNRVVCTPDGSLFVPVAFWGLWSTADEKSFRWICDDEIGLVRNANMRISITQDGTLFGLDTRGFLVSTDHGCTWTRHTGVLANEAVTDFEPHPSDGATAWLATSTGVSLDADGAVPMNSVWVTHDHGATLSPLPGLAGQTSRLYQSVRAASAQIIYASSLSPAPDFTPALHRSEDGGATFIQPAVGFAPAGQRVVSYQVMAIDPRNPKVIYLRASVRVTTATGTTPQQVLLRSTDGGETTTELYRLDAETLTSGLTLGLNGVAIDTARGRVLVATKTGLLAADDATGGAPLAALSPIGGLTQTQCVTTCGGALYACANNFADKAAVARSDDGGKTWRSLLQYCQTAGPAECPKGTPVGDRCPGYWQMYSDQLGVGMCDGQAVDMGVAPPGGKGCDYAAGEPAPTRPWPLGLVALGALALVAAGALALRRPR